MPKNRYRLQAFLTLATDDPAKPAGSVYVRYKNSVVKIMSHFHSEEEGDVAVIIVDGIPRRVPADELEDV